MTRLTENLDRPLNVWLKRATTFKILVMLQGVNTAHW